MLDTVTIDGLLGFPCLFAYETALNLDARIGRLIRIEPRQARVFIAYEVLANAPSISAPELVRFAVPLDIEVRSWEMNRTHWALKDIDLVGALQGVGILTAEQAAALPTFGNTISEVTRRAIIDELLVSGTSWAGRLPEDQFCRRLYQLSEMASADPRFSNAEGDIWQHRVTNADWAADWIFFDRRFDLLHSPDQKFIRFLCETVHPVVRPSSEEARQLVQSYNEHLRRDSWAITEIGQLSGRPLFGASRSGLRTEVFFAPTGWQKVDRQVQEARFRLETARNEEHYQAVGLMCREVLISAAEAVFDPNVHQPRDGIQASSSDAKRLLEAIFDRELAGNANEEARVAAKASVKLSYALQHKRTADFRTAAICLEAATTIVNLLTIVSGRRAPTLTTPPP